MESWKEKDLRELEERYDKQKKAITARIDACGHRLSIAEQKAKQRAGALLAFAANSDNEQLQTLHAFLAGEITHFFIDGYSPEIVSWDDNETYCTDSWGSHMRIEGMKLVSIFGSSDGKMDYRINQYRDGSGGSSKRIIPCKSYEHALAEAQQSLDASAELYVSGTQRSLHIDGWLKIDGIQIPADALKKYTDAKRENQLERILKLRAEIGDLEVSIASEVQDS